MSRVAELILSCFASDVTNAFSPLSLQTRTWLHVDCKARFTRYNLLPHRLSKLWSIVDSVCLPVVKPVAQPDWQPVVSCKRGISLQGGTTRRDEPCRLTSCESALYRSTASSLIDRHSDLRRPAFKQQFRRPVFCSCRTTSVEHVANTATALWQSRRV